jgi:hypothetical protein
MKNKNLIYLALGLGALYFFTKKKDTETTETTTTTPDVGNDKNDPVVDDVADVIDTGVVVDSNAGNPVVDFMQTGSSSSSPSGVFTTVKDEYRSVGNTI